MSYFSGCRHNLVIINNLSSMAFFIFFFFFFFSFTILLQTSMAAEGDDPFLYELSSREEMVQLAGYGEEKLSTVLVTGTVLCEACLHGEPQLRAWPVPGALVTLECHTRRKWSKTSVVQAITDEYGDFTIDLPSHLHAIPNLDKTCSVKVVQMPKDKVCRPSHVKKYRGLKLSSVQNGIRSYTAGEITFLHSTSKPLQACTKRGSSHKQIAW